MFMAKSEYDRGVNTFSPEGRLFQVEYAIQAVKLGSTAVGIRTSEGVVLAVEKRLTSSLLKAESVEKIMEVDSHVGAAMSGLIADARTLVDDASSSSPSSSSSSRSSRVVSSLDSFERRVSSSAFLDAPPVQWRRPDTLSAAGMDP